MAGQSIQFQTFLGHEISRVKGVYYPVRAGFLRRALIRHAKTVSLHPNPDDEFCFPDIGPNYEIVAEYERDFRRHASYRIGSDAEKKLLDPLTVQKARPV